VTLNGDSQGIDGFHAEDGALDVLFKRNLVYGTDTAVTLDGSSTDVELVSNTIAANNDGLQATNCASLDLRNTIFSDHSGTGLTYEGCAATQLHTYNLYWNNGTNQTPAVTGVGELYLDPLFVDASAHNYHTEADSPVIDAGDPSDTPPPGTSERVDIGYIEQGRAAFYVDLDYCDTCENDGLTWGVDAFDNIPDGLSAAETEIAALTDLSGQTEPLYTVYVGDGTYWGNLSLPSFVRLAGSGPDTTKLDANSGDLITIDGAFYSEIRDILTEPLNMGGDCAVTITGGSRAITITRNVFAESLGRGYTDGVCLVDRSEAVVSFNTFYNINNGVNLYNSSNTAVISNNILPDIKLSGGADTAYNVDIRYNYLGSNYLWWELPLGPGNDHTWMRMCPKAAAPAPTWALMNIKASKRYRPLCCWAMKTLPPPLPIPAWTRWKLASSPWPTRRSR
ncbi:MAG: right-handed parallel beta-helix repeat-containing protein, partial [Anaerolineae bacterium]